MRKLKPDEIRRTFDSKTLGIVDTSQLKPLKGIVGQKRALRALEFGLNITEKGFNIYVAGPPGTGRQTAVKSYIEELAKKRETPSDWCYVNNFKDPYHPKALKLPTGKGRELKQDMETLIRRLRAQIPKIFESEQYRTKKENVVKDLQEKKNTIFQKLKEEASKNGFALQSTPMGVFVIPMKDGRPMQEPEFKSLPEEEKRKLQKKRRGLEKKLQESTKVIRNLDREAQDRLQGVDKDAVRFVVGGLIEDLIEKYGNLSEVVQYIRAVEQDILENIPIFRQQQGPQPPAPFPLPPGFGQELAFRRYEVNVLVDNSEMQGAPVVIELNPTYTNLFGRVEKETQMGALHTDFTLIKPGALHRANGGFLVLPVEDILRNIFAYDGLKRALRNGEIVIEEIGERLGFLTTKGLKPEPISLNVKVVLIGIPLLYHLLYIYDEEFNELFKVRADFDIQMEWSRENIQNYLSFVCALCEKEKIKHLDKDAVARVIEYGARLASDRERLSTKFAELADIIREANYWAKEDGNEKIEERHIKKAIDEKIFRSNLIEERMQELIERGTILVDTDEERVGQVNGLAILNIGDYIFGKPSRITVSVSMGREGVIDIEREVKLGGPIHSKGVMILGGYLSQRYAQDKPLSLSARLVFEQSYEGVEGDSASSTELYALLSALSEIPVKQGIAVTGSVNQRGEVQAIGGVNHKIEGFFDICKKRGLTAEQGVVIPESNVKNLMLKEEVVEAVREGKFHIWAVKCIDEGIEILTGMKAGERKEDGKFPEGTINYLVDKKLRELATTYRDFAKEKS